MAFYQKAKVSLAQKGWDTGFSISCVKGESNPNFNIDNQRFMQMGAVVGDNGTCNDPMDYYFTDNYRNKAKGIRLFIYKVAASAANRRVDCIRKS
jgi:hypothetical protein